MQTCPPVIWMDKSHCGQVNNIGGQDKNEGAHLKKIINVVCYALKMGINWVICQRKQL